MDDLTFSSPFLHPKIVMDFLLVMILVLDKDVNSHRTVISVFQKGYGFFDFLLSLKAYLMFRVSLNHRYIQQYRLEVGCYGSKRPSQVCGRLVA